MRSLSTRLLSCAILSTAALSSAYAQTLTNDGLKFRIESPRGVMEVYAVANDVLKVTFLPKGEKPHPTDVIDPKGLRLHRPVGLRNRQAILTDTFSAEAFPAGIRVTAGANHFWIPLSNLEDHEVMIGSDSPVKFFGGRGYGLDQNVAQPGDTLQRSDSINVTAAWQGDGGAPFAFTTQWGLFVDSVDGRFENPANSLRFLNSSRKDTEFYLILGGPLEVQKRVADLTGHPPMPPKWALGFMNSQWGTTEKDVIGYVDEYRRRQIPLDAFILDFDFKAWGEDNYGEFRWNSSSNPGSVSAKDYPNGRFPDGESGAFAKDLLAKGVKLVGIMKPRLVIENTEHKLSKAGEVIEAHHWSLPGEKPYNEYFSNRPALDLDFSKKEVRSWYWSHAKHLFETGIAGWWNDEADSGFDSLGHFHMQQSLYEGQRSASNDRVFSLNRNFYLGAQRYAFGTWSGDIDTGFKSMKDQAIRFLAMLNLGQAHWSMDTGGFQGHPSPENYARWMEFAALVPIMRVHNTYGERRQPWVYGPVAEAAAKKAIEFRYSLLPSLVSWEREAYETGVGIARPLFWEFPDDAQSAATIDEWMLGDSLLVAPVLEQGQTQKKIYLPKGSWFDLKTQRDFYGPTTITIETDAQTWSDIPIFARGGSMQMTQDVVQSTQTSDTPSGTTLTYWLGDHPSKFVYYVDDGTTYAYEKGSYLRQEISASMDIHSLIAKIQFAEPTGRWKGKKVKGFFHCVYGGGGRIFVNGKEVPHQMKDCVMSIPYEFGTKGTIEIRATPLD